MYPIDNDKVPGDLRTGRMHYAAVEILTPFSPNKTTPAVLAKELVNSEETDFVLDTAINTLLFGSSVDGLTVDELKKLIYKNVRQKIYQRCKVGRGNWRFV